MTHVLCPDKFKGCLPAVDVANALRSGTESVRPDVSVDSYAVSDGGDDLLEAVATQGFVVTEACATGGTAYAAIAVLNARWTGNHYAVRRRSASQRRQCQPAPTSSPYAGFTQLSRGELQASAISAVYSLSSTEPNRARSIERAAALLHDLGQTIAVRHIHREA